MAKKKIIEEDSFDPEEVKEIIVENKSGFNTLEVVVIIIISILFGIVIGNIVSNSNKNISGVKVSRELQEFITTYNNLVDNYYDKIQEKDLIDSAIDGMISSLDDPYSVYMNGKETEEFNQTVDGSYVGIGATVGSRDGNNYIISMFDNSPAKAAGLKDGDVFLRVDNTDVSSLEISKLTDMIKGKENTKVEITVLRDNEEITKTLVRHSIEIPTVTDKVFERDGKKVGYIYVDSFAATTYKQFKKSLLKLEDKNINSLIIDVRSNPGGHLNQVTKVLELFMDKKHVLYQVEFKGAKTKKYSTSSTNRNYDIVVLIDSASASASEILAAAFKESYSNATLVGSKSYGKGTVQKAYHLSSGSSFKYTTEKWLTPKGNWIDQKGVNPDVEVLLTEEYKNNPTDENDTQLQKALELLAKESN